MDEEYTDDGELRLYEIHDTSVLYTTQKQICIQSINRDGTIETIYLKPNDIVNIYFEMWKRNIIWSSS